MWTTSTPRTWAARSCPGGAEQYLAEQRAFWRALRGGGVLTEEDQREAIERQQVR